MRKATMGNMILRGSCIRNTMNAIGIAVYTGEESMIMKQVAKKRFQRVKKTQMMKTMDVMLGIVFGFVFIIAAVFAGLHL